MSDIFYQQYGDPHGAPLVYCHGSPGSHLEATRMDAIAREKQISLIAFDRPGLGKSKYQKLNQLVEEANLVEQLADHLRLKKFGIVGLSGGASTALAAAHHIPSRLTFCASMVGWAPIHDQPALQQQLAPADRFFLRLSAYMPWAFNLGFAFLGHRLKGKKESLINMIGGSLSEVDKAVLQQDQFADFFLQDLRLAFAQGSKGPAQDAYLRYKPWGFDLTDIACPVHIYAAAEDKFVPLAFAHAVHNAIPKSKLTIWGNTGHLTAFEKFDQVADHFLQSISDQR